MAHVLHLYNVLGAMTERAWLDYPLALSRRGWATTFACERVADEAPAVEPEVVALQRIAVEPTDDVDAQMRTVARCREGDTGKRTLLERPIDLVHGHFGPRVLHAAAWLARGVPVVISLYGYDASRLLRDPAWAGRYRWAAAHGATFAVLCEAMRRRLVDDLGLPEQRVRIVHLGVEPDAWAYEPQPMSKPPRFLFVGRLTPKKAPTDLLDALAALRDRHGIAATLEVIGEGPMETMVRQRIEALRLGDAVRMLGGVPREVVGEHMRSATALVLPSVTAPDGDEEGTPVVLMEAAARGLPCVTTGHAGNPDVLPPLAHELGLVTPPGDPAALAQAMARVAALPTDDRRELQDAGRAHVERHFSLAGTVDGYDALYRELLGES